MITANSIIERMRAAGFRRTPFRSALLEALLASDAPLSVPELQEQLNNAGLNPNKTSLYRELETLASFGVTEESTIGGLRKIYVPRSGIHHHHLVCTSCSAAVCVDIPEVEEALGKAEAALGKLKQFSDIKHDITLYGRCAECA